MSNYWIDKTEEKVVANHIIPIWDFNTAMERTLGKKYESEYVRIVEISNAVFRRTLQEENYIILKQGWEDEIV